MKKLLIASGALAVLATAVLAIAHPAQAAGIVGGIPDKGGNVTKNDITDVLMQLIQWGLMFASAVAAIFIVVNGYQYVMSAGNPEKIEKAKEGLTWSIGGLVLAISSYALVVLLASNLGFTQIGTLKNHQPASLPGSTQSILKAIADMLFVFGGAVAVSFIILGGYRYVTSQGNRDAVEKAKQTILYAVVGLILLFASVLIFNFVSDQLSVTNQFK